MSSLLERMAEGFDSFFDELNKVSASELIAELDSLGLVSDVQEDNVPHGCHYQKRIRRMMKMTEWIRWYVHMALLNLIANGCGGVSDKIGSIFAVILAMIFFIGCFLDKDDEKENNDD